MHCLRRGANVIVEAVPQLVERIYEATSSIGVEISTEARWKVPFMSGSGEAGLGGARSGYG
jgi:hypothetical protein